MPNQTPQTLVVEEDQREHRGSIINDFSIQVATVNGSGSQSSNTVLMRSIFQMGIPVSGKNLFPSRSEEHTSELQSHSDLVCRLLLEKKKKTKNKHYKEKKQK